MELHRKPVDESIEKSILRAARYLDAYDVHDLRIRRDPEVYRQIASYLRSAMEARPVLLEQLAGSHSEAIDSLREDSLMNTGLQHNRRFHYPELDQLMVRFTLWNGSIR